MTFLFLILKAWIPLYILFGSLVDLVHEFSKDLLLNTGRLIDLINHGFQFSIALAFIRLVDRLNVQILVELLNLGFGFSILLTIVFLD